MLSTTITLSMRNSNSESGQTPGHTFRASRFDQQKKIVQENIDFLFVSVYDVCDITAVYVCIIKGVF